jgi:hypothetical protein
MKKKILTTLVLAIVCLTIQAQRVNIVVSKKATNREQYAVEYLQKKLTAMGYSIVKKNGDCQIALSCKHSGKSEGYQISHSRQGINVIRNDPSGVIYGCVELADRIRQTGSLQIDGVEENPGMVMRGTCIGLQKTVYLPGHAVYEYPYTPENFPWFYDKAEWVKYLDMMVEYKMNSLYLWDGHPFASLV